MKEKLFDFLTIRHINQAPVDKATKGIEVVSTITATFTDPGKTLTEKQTYLDSLKPQYLNGSLKSHSPELDAMVVRFRTTGFKASPADTITLIKAVFGADLPAILSSQDHQYKFGRVSRATLVNALETGEVPDDLLMGQRAVALIASLDEGSIADEDAVYAAFQEKLRLPGVVANFHREKLAAEINAARVQPKAPKDVKKEIADLTAEISKYDRMLDEASLSSPKDIVTKMPQVTTGKSGIDLTPSRFIQFSTDKWDGFSTETKGFIQQKKFKQEETSVDEFREKIVLSREEATEAMAALAGPARQSMIYLNGKFQNFDQVMAASSLTEVGPLVFSPNMNRPKYMRPLGIGELRTVEQTQVRYSIGEIAHIENVLEGEEKVRDHLIETSRSVTEDSESSSSETLTQERSTSESQELAKATQETVKENMAFDISVQVNADVWPGIEIKTDTSFGWDKSKEKSKEESQKFAKEVVEKAVQSVHQSVSEKRTETKSRKITERNTHTLDNSDPGNGHVVGIYRWLNKKYTAQVRTHGTRMLYEFIIPEPAAFHMYAEALQSKQEIVLDAPIRPRKPHGEEQFIDLEAHHLNAGNYKTYAAQYNVSGLNRPPADSVLLSKSITIDPSTKTDDVPITTEFTFRMPEGYVPGLVIGVGQLVWPDKGQNLVAKIGKKGAIVEGLSTTETEVNGKLEVSHDNDFQLTCWTDYFPNIRGKRPVAIEANELPVSMVIYNAKGLIMNMVVSCALTREAFEAWQNATFDKIMAAYYEMKEEFEEKRRGMEFSKGVQISGKNPLRNKEVMETELKKHCISFMTNSYLDRYQSLFRQPDQAPEIDFARAFSNGHQIQFFEQAFEWTKMMKQLYPYFWSPKDNWHNQRDQDSSDPEFGKFLRAGAARVILPVREGYEDAVAFYMSTFIVPTPENGITIGDNLFVDIVDMLREEQDRLQGAATGESWEVTVPTDLVMLDDADAIQRIEQVIL